MNEKEWNCRIPTGLLRRAGFGIMLAGRIGMDSRWRILTSYGARLEETIVESGQASTTLCRSSSPAIVEAAGRGQFLLNPGNSRSQSFRRNAASRSLNLP